MISLPTHYLAFVPMVSRISRDARVLPVNNQIDFQNDATYTLDLTAIVQATQLSNPIQSVYVDASQVKYGNTLIECSGTGQRLVIVPYSQGYYPLVLMQNSFVFTFTNSGNLGDNGLPRSILNVLFINVPYVTQVWRVPPSENAGGYGVGPLGETPLGS